MSVSIATGGLFNQCCGGRGGGGGAPPYRQNEEEAIRPFILVKKVDSKVLDTLDEMINKIQVKLVD